MSCILGITGGIASGKSVFTQLLQKYFPAALFDCDLAARELFEKDSSVQEQLRAAFPEALSGQGLDRAIVRRIVFAQPARRTRLEAILHPRIHDEWRKLAGECRATGKALLVDIPLLFETHCEECFDRIIVVGCRVETQLRRLQLLRNLGENVSRAIIDSQQKLEDKIAKADHLIWNESSFGHLELQARLLGGYFQQRYG